MNRKIIVGLLFLIMLSFFVSAESSKINFTLEEQEWIREHPVIRISADPDFAPVEFFDENGEYVGLAADYVKVAEERTGLKFEMNRYENWVEVLDAMDRGDIDMLPANSPEPEFYKNYLFTDLYQSFSDVMVIPEEVSPDFNLNDLEREEVLVVEEWPEAYLLRETHPEIKIVDVGSTVEGLLKVSSGEAKYFYSYLPTASYYIKENGIQGLKFSASSLYRRGGGMMVRKDWQELVSILNKVFDSMTLEEKEAILVKWVPGFEIMKDIELTQDEESWLVEHRRIRAGTDSNWKPLDFIDEFDVHQGICSDYLSLVGDLLGVNMVPQKTESWNEMISKMKQGKIDVIPCIVKTEERSEYLLFTEPYLKLPLVIATREDISFTDVSDLDDFRLAVVKGFANEEWIKADYPKAIRISVDSVEEALVAVSKGKVDGMIDTPMSIKYYSQGLGIDNLKIFEVTSRNIQLSFAVRKDWSEMIEILEKALSVIPESNKKNIQDKWTTEFVETKTNRNLLLKIALGILFLAFVIIGIILLRNKKLGTKKIVEKTVLKKVEEEKNE